MAFWSGRGGRDTILDEVEHNAREDPVFYVYVTTTSGEIETVIDLPEQWDIGIALAELEHAFGGRGRHLSLELKPPSTAPPHLLRYCDLRLARE